MGKSRHRKDQKKKSAIRSKEIAAKRYQVQKLVKELEDEFTKLQAHTEPATESFYQPPLLTLTPTK
jgi:hypothetical protein